jgi:hypothetical protein
MQSRKGIAGLRIRSVYPAVVVVDLNAAASSTDE